jgi:ribosomal-protein-alanine N-acetyltransferase
LSTLTITTQRLLLIPFTTTICTGILNDDFNVLAAFGLQPGNGYPDDETLATLPRILINLGKVPQPSGFESWMVVLKSSNTIIGDVGFKGLPDRKGAVDIGYGIIESERKKGYALEATAGLINWAFIQPQVKVITARSLTDNIPSARVLQKLHFTSEAEHDSMIHWMLNRKY